MDVSSIPLSTYAEIFTAVGTLALATVTYLALRTTIKQSSILKKEAEIRQKEFLYLETDLVPELKINSIILSGNKFRINFTNRGKGRAIWIAIEAYFSFAKLITFEGNKDFSLDVSTVNINYENKKRPVIFIPYMNFVSGIINNKVILEHGKNISIDYEPIFLIKLQKSDVGERREIDINKAIEIMKIANKQYAWIKFELNCFNKIRQLQVPIYIAQFIFDVKKHKTLEEALADKGSYPPLMRQVPVSDWETFRGMESYQYRNIGGKE